MPAQRPWRRLGQAREERTRMRDDQKKSIAELRSRGLRYSDIAASLGLTKSQVSGYCRRNSIPCGQPDMQGKTCPECGRAVSYKAGAKRRRFCSDECRRAWWNAHPERVKRRAVYEFVCAFCGRAFDAYGNAHRKYCSHACYIADRFGKARPR